VNRLRPMNWRNRHTLRASSGAPAADSVAALLRRPAGAAGAPAGNVTIVVDGRVISTTKPPQQPAKAAEGHQGALAPPRQAYIVTRVVDGRRATVQELDVARAADAGSLLRALNGPFPGVAPQTPAPSPCDGAADATA
jgi:hypothetical protein